MYAEMSTPKKFLSQSELIWTSLAEMAFGYWILQVGNIGGRQVYRNVFHALSSIVKEQGPRGLYRGLGASCIKIIPAAGISFMCYEACKRVLVEEQEKAKVIEQEEEKLAEELKT